MQRQKQNKKKLIIGITGSLACGKSTVAKLFAYGGRKLIDADKIAREALTPGTFCYKKIISAFGKGILDKNRKIDRKILSCIVFNNEASLKKLNSIVHPQVINIIKKEILNSGKRDIVLDAPLLIEAGLRKIVGKLIVVRVDKNKQIQRARIKTSLGRVDILKRIRSQIPLHVKLGFADFIIDNNGSIKETEKQVAQIRRKLWKN
jgi:dephospho-CoA kinase